ncbi:hypothetical protein IYX23_05625 [Methylocystis sp. L43]|uniref:hypothetical protein n=1 Tax=unclassified Methylocystis TaxID=2625913 RepID=UPI0018C33D63|nr:MULTISPECIES: hypothetical protein [unclassified Methylocystis]MBG0797166.1 hypothetical protein [Methylocystis sp. L43]MBG0804963.1 hypothetical protein [Methylocystis sp. H15]
MIVAELEPDVLTARAQARQALADAIAGVDSARQRLAEAKRAADLATDRAIELRNRIDALAERASSAKANASGDSVIGALLRGECLGSRSSPAEEARTEIAALERELDAVRQARQTAQDEIENRKSAIGLGEMRVRRMIGGVLRSSGSTERLLTGLIDLEREIIRRRLGLAFLLRQDGVPRALLAEVERLLDGHALPTRAAATDHWGKNPASQAWADALATLERDADARLPLD